MFNLITNKLVLIGTFWYINDMDKDFYSINEFSKKFGVCYRTILRSIHNGRINAFRIGASDKSKWVIPHTEIHRMGIIDFNKIVDNLVDEKTKEMK